MVSSMCDSQEFVWDLYPYCQLCIRQIVKESMKMIHDKTNRVSQLSPSRGGRNVHSLSQVLHWPRRVFIKRCQNCLINNVGILQFWAHLLMHSVSCSPQILCDSRGGDCIDSEDCNRFSVDIRDWKLCRSRKRQIDRWSILRDIKFLTSWLFTL
jgi:hypothetical protein